MNVILSTALILENGDFNCRSITLDQAIEFVKLNNPVNFCSHQTVKVLNIEPAVSRETCKSYDIALCLKPKGRIEFGKEYTVDEIMEIGVYFQLITKLTIGHS
jgi:hypothetical protein